MRRHPGQQVTTCCAAHADDAGGQAVIDTALLPVLRAVWAAGLHTTASCQQPTPAPAAMITLADVATADALIALAFTDWVPRGHRSAMMRWPRPGWHLTLNAVAWTADRPLTACPVVLTVPHADLGRLARLPTPSGQSMAAINGW